MYLASTLKMGGHIVDILDIPALKWDYKKILKYLQSNTFDLVGLSCNIFTLREAITMSIIIKKFKPDTYVVIGGASTIYPNQKILAKTSKIDFIIRDRKSVV